MILLGNGSIFNPKELSQLADLIYAIDDPDGTLYVLCRNGRYVDSCDWPGPLEDAYPEARRAGTLASGRELIVDPQWVTGNLYDELVSRVREKVGNPPNGG